ncbi:hypothetical protein ARSEF1564_007993 [Beauveria bassiana]
MIMIFNQVAKRYPKTATAPNSRTVKHGGTMPGHLQERLNREQPQSATNDSALQAAVNATEPGYGHAKSTSTMEAEFQLQDTSVSPDLRVPSSSGSASSAETPGQLSKTAPQAAEGGTSAIKSATLASLCGTSNGMRIFELLDQRPIQSSMLTMDTSAGGATHAAASRQVYDHAKRAASPTGSASEGPPSKLPSTLTYVTELRIQDTPKCGNEAADAQDDVVEHATQLRAPLSKLPILNIADKDSKMHGGLLDASLSPPTTKNNGERGALHCEKEHNNANAAATPEGSISRGILSRLRIRASTPGKSYSSNHTRLPNA